MINNHRILITGATGAIGQEILRQMNTLGLLNNVTVLVRSSKKNQKKLRPYSDKINIVYGDITDNNAMLTACKNKDIIIHLAAIIPTVSDEDDALIQKINVQGTRNLITVLESVSPNAFLLYSSSIAVYGDRLKNPLITIKDTLDLNQQDFYGQSKINAEAIIQKSNLKWSIFRLTAIMGVGSHKLSGLMFEMPLNTPMEIATLQDTARAFIHALDKIHLLQNRIFNLSGGEDSRILYFDFLSKAFKIFGLGNVDFPEFAFARQNFHCGYYDDNLLLDEILQFRQENIRTYFDQLNLSVSTIQKISTRPFAGFIKRYLLSLSKPYKAYKEGNEAQIKYYFGQAN